MTVRLRGALPAEEMNGLARIEASLTADPKSKRIVVGVVDVAQRRDHGDGVFEPTVEFLQVELLEGKFRDRGVKLLQAAYGRRTGSRQLDAFEDDQLDADGDVGAPPVAPVAVGGPRFQFAPATEGRWWLEYRTEDGELLARRGGLGIQADLTLGRQYTLEGIDATGDETLSTLARMLVEQAEEQAEDDAKFRRAAPTEAEIDAALAEGIHSPDVGGESESQVSQYVGPDGVDEADAYGGEPDENEDGDETSSAMSPSFSG